VGKQISPDEGPKVRSAYAIRAWQKINKEARTRKGELRDAGEVKEVVLADLGGVKAIDCKTKGKRMKEYPGRKCIERTLGTGPSLVG